MTLQASIQLQDRMSKPIRAITNSMNTIISTFESMETVSSHPVDVAALQAARAQINGIEADFIQASDAVEQTRKKQDILNNAVRRGGDEVNGLLKKVKQVVGAYAGIQGIKMGVSFIADTISLQNVQSEAETKLGAIMRQRMGASPAEIQSIKALTAAQQELGVVGDEVQITGAQQLATFLNTGDALSTLIPAMNNLAVQQNGVNVSTESMVNIGNMMGKVMQGQVGALTRVGVTFDAAQEKVLKYGNEQQRAATLAQVITDNVSNMNAIMAATPQGQMQQMANAWGDIKEAVGARLYPAVTRFFNSVNTNMPRAENLVMGLAGALNVVVTVFSYITDGAMAVAGFFQDYWTIIEPIIWGVIGALVVYNTTMGIGWLTTLKDAGAKIMQAGATGLASAATFVQTVAQQGLNAALAACPITWIIILIVALVAALYAGVAAVNKFKGTSISATGLIGGAFGVLGASIINTFVLPTWNTFAAFANFIGNFCNDPVAAVKVLFYDMCLVVIGYVTNMAHAIEAVINSIPFMEVHITSRLDEFEDKIKAAQDKVKSESEWKEYVKSIDYIDYGNAAKAGYEFGANVEDKVRGAFDGIKDLMNGGGAQDAWEGVAANTGNTAGNTAAMADSMNLLDEDLKYMRDAAEQEVINRFTLAELKVDVNNNNTLTTQTDFDDVNRMLGEVTGEILAVAAEGG